jgi:hypothetical protein
MAMGETGGKFDQDFKEGRGATGPGDWQATQAARGLGIHPGTRPGDGHGPASRAGQANAARADRLRD